MQTASRRGRASFLSQIPEVPPSVAQADSLTDFFTYVQRTYERAQEAMEMAKSGYNADIAKTTISGSGGVLENNDNAWEALKRAKGDGLVTGEEAGVLAHDVMGPLGKAIGQTQAALIENQGRDLNFYWNSFSDFVATTIANSTGFVTKKWHDFAKVYKIIDTYLKTSNDFMASVQDAAQSPDAVSYLNSLKMSIGSLAAQKTYVETSIQAVGIPLSALRDQAAKEDVSTLGAVGPGIMGAVIFGVSVATILKVLGLIFSTFVFFMFGVFDTILPVIGLERLVILRIKRQELNQLKVKKEIDQETSDKSMETLKGQDGNVKGQIKDAQATIGGLGQVLGMQEKADELKKKVAEEREKLGLSTPLSEQAWVPWALAIGGGALLAVILYKFVHRDNA